MAHRTRHLLSVLALFLPVVACAPEDPEDVADDDTENGEEALSNDVRFDVITHNIAGGMLNEGRAEALDNVDNEIARLKPDAVLLQEVCQTQYEAFVARHPAWGIAFTVTRPNHPKCGPLGDIIATPHELVNVAPPVDLHHADPGRVTTLLCGDVKHEKRKGSVKICTTHLVSRAEDPADSDERRRKQVLNLVDALRPALQADQMVVFGGDLNSGPQKELFDPVYRLKRNGNWGGGAFDEADQTDPQREARREDGITCANNACRSGEPTHDNSKLDHIFFSANKITGEINGEVRNKGKSDHNLYRGSAVIRWPAKKKN